MSDKNMQVVLSSLLLREKEEGILYQTVKLLENRENPDKADWLKAFYLAYNRVVNPAIDRQRISPILCFSPHWVKTKTISGTGTKTLSFMENATEGFAESRIFILTRDHCSHIGCDFDRHYKVQWDMGNFSCVEWGFLNRVYALHGAVAIEDWIGQWMERQREETAVMWRFEDLKLHPKAATMAFCTFLDIPWSKTFMECTRDGKSLYSEEDRGFNPAPVYKRRENILNNFDYFRFELLSCGLYKNWGYAYKYYDETGYTKEQIMTMFALPFKMEILAGELEGYPREEGKRHREQFMEAVKQWLEEHWEAYQKQELPSRLPWLKPDPKYLTGKLYS